MPFITIPFSRGPLTDTAFVTLSVTNNRGSAMSGLAITLSGPMCEQMCWTSSTRVNVMEGIEEDAGMFMLEIAEHGYKFYGATKGHTMSLRVSESRLRNYQINKNTAEYTVVEHTADKAAGIMLKLPTWLIYTGPAAKPKMQLVQPPQRRK